MYFSHSSVLAIIPFLVAAISVDPRSIRRGDGGVAIPIAKRNEHHDADPSKLSGVVQRSIA